MNMKKRIFQPLKSTVLFTAVALATASIVGCGSDETGGQQADMSGDAVRVTASVVPSVTSALTRGADGLNADKFSDVSGKVMVKVSTGGGYTAYEFGIASDGENLTAPNEDGPTFPSGITSADVYGWYPYNSGSTTFTVQSDQSTDANYNSSDLMLADKATATKTTPAQLTFRHVLTKVKVRVTPGTGVTVNSVALKSLKTQVDISDADPTALTATTKNDGASGDITLMGSIDAATTSCAVFPAQTVTGDFIVINASAGGGAAQNVTYSFSSSKAFAANNEYVVNIRLDAETVETGSVSLADWEAAGNNPVNIGGSGGGGDVTLDKTDVVLTYRGDSETVTASAGGSSYTAFSGNTSIATVSGSSPTFTIAPVAAGTTSVVVFGAADADETNSSFVNVTVNPLEFQTSNSSGYGYITVASIPDQIYTGSAVTPEPTVTVKGQNGNQTLTKDTDYELSYSSNTEAGTNTATCTVIGIGNYTGSTSVTFSITSKTLYSNITEANIGMVVCTNGYVYQNCEAATTDGASPLGMLIYVGAHTGKATSGGNTNTSQTVSCTNGVIAALQDAGTDNDRMYNNTLPTNNSSWTARNYTSTAITTLGSWVSATDNDWKDFMVACSNAYIAQGLTGATVTANSNTPVAFWALMERCGGTGATAVVAGGQHWTNCGVSSPSNGTTYSWPYFSASVWAVASDTYDSRYSSTWGSSNGAQAYAVRAVRAF